MSQYLDNPFKDIAGWVELGGGTPFWAIASPLNEAE